jgi:homoserine kinase
MTQKKVCVKVPASTANLGPGFDVLGMALNLYAWIEMSEADDTIIELLGDQMPGVPTDKSNLIYKVAQQLFARAGVSKPELHIAMYSQIPLTRGLGSSASAIIGALMAANALVDHHFSEQELFDMATEWERHPDNVGASLFGGFVVTHWDGDRAYHIRIDPPSELDVIVAIPAFQLSTEKAREALPKQLTMQQAVHNIGYSSMLVAAFASGRLDMIRHAMKDELHQPYRAPMIPGMEHILAQSVNHGALGVALSGAGPTLLAFIERTSNRKHELEQFLLQTLAQAGVEAELLQLKVDLVGALELTPYPQNSTLFATIQDQMKQ